MMERRDPAGQAKLRDYALLVPQLGRLIARLVRDPRVPARPKATLVFVAIYLVSPIDLIPSVVPGLGQLDDLMLAALTLDQLLNHVPEEIVREHWDGEQDLLEVVREVLRMSTSFVPGPVKKLFSS
jgi:uncharacterized membrane protein YkvA (DUF1232 family)